MIFGFNTVLSGPPSKKFQVLEVTGVTEVVRSKILSESSARKHSLSQ